jgi:hypothetical protein
MASPPSFAAYVPAANIGLGAILGFFVATFVLPNSVQQPVALCEISHVDVSTARRSVVMPSMMGTAIPIGASPASRSFELQLASPHSLLTASHFDRAPVTVSHDEEAQWENYMQNNAPCSFESRTADGNVENRQLVCTIEAYTRVSIH